MLRIKSMEEYQAPITDTLELSGTGVLCNSTTGSESSTEGFLTDDVYGW